MTTVGFSSLLGGETRRLSISTGSIFSGSRKAISKGESAGPSRGRARGGWTAAR